MEKLKAFIDFFGVPASVGLIAIGVFVILQLLGELIELKGKVVPEFMKIRKAFKRKKAEKAAQAQLFKDMKKLLADVNEHYSSDNIEKRNAWIDWVNNRAEVYDSSIDKINSALEKATVALDCNTRMTEKMFIENSRDRIIDFASKVSNPVAPVSMEEFNRIFKVYDEYEIFLTERHMTNGEVDIAMTIIKDAFKERIKHKTFLEDIKDIRK